jgi:hypothetical protein
MRCSRSLYRHAAVELFSRDRFAINPSTRFARLICLATLGHAGPIRITPLVGEGAARLQGRRACRTDRIAGGSRAAKGTAAIQRTAIVVASPGFVVVLANNLAFEVNIVISPMMT